MSKYKETFLYKTGYSNGYNEGIKKAVELAAKQPPVINITVNISNLDKVTETERELEQVTNVLNNYKSMLFGL